MDSSANVSSYASVASMRTSDNDLTRDSHETDAHSDDEDTPIFPRETINPGNVLPQRPLSAFFSVPQPSVNSVNDIFSDLQNMGINATAVKCLQRTSLGSYCITFADEDHRNTFLKKASIIPHFVPGNPSIASSSLPVYVAAYDAAPHELKDETRRLRLSAFGTVKTFRRCRLQYRPAVFTFALASFSSN